MPSAIARTLSGSLLDHVFGNTAYTPLGTIHVAVLTTSASDWTVGTGAVQSAGVARIALTNNLTNFPSAVTAGTLTSKGNGIAIAFGNAPANLTLVGFALYSAASAGVWLGGGTLNAPLAVSSGSPIRFDAGTMTIRGSSGAGEPSGFLFRRLLDLAFGSAAYAAPANIFGAYFTTAPSNAIGTGGVEPSVGAYARVSRANNTTNFPNATGSAVATKTCATDIAFPNPTAPQGTVVAGGLIDAATAGNLLWSGALVANRVVSTTTTEVKFTANTIALNITPVA